MLKKTVTYEDFNGDMQTEELYFNLSELELVEMEVDVEGGLVAYLTSLVEGKDGKRMIAELKKWILTGYGVKSVDGKRFTKDPAIVSDFQYSAAFQQVFFDLTQKEDEIMQFFLGMIPRKYAKIITDQQVQDKPTGPPKPPKPAL